MSVVLNLSFLSQATLWALEASWDRARYQAQDEGRMYLSIACKGRFNI